MKKSSIFMAMAAVALGFTSCEAEREPVYTPPTDFVLNIPAMEDQYIVLNETGTIELVASQPDYGYSAIANYSAEMSVDPSFETFYALEPAEAHQARMTISQNDVALGLCQLLDLTTEDAYNAQYPDGMPYMKVYFRAVCEIQGVGNSLIKSNVVAYNYMKGYMAVPVPGYIYLIGSPAGNWTSPDEANAATLAEWRLFEPDNAIGSKVYTATFDLPASPMFRFYSKLTGWDGGDSYGYIVDDNATDFPEFNGSESFTETLIKGKGAFNFPNFAGGTVTLVVNMSDPNNMTFEMIPGEFTPVVSKYVYMVGNNGGWVEPVEGTYEDWKLEDAEGTGIYAATFDLSDLKSDDGALYCRFYQNLTGWGAAQWASVTGQDYDVASGVAVPTSTGEGCFKLADAVGKTVQVVLDTNLNEVTFTFVN